MRGPTTDFFPDYEINVLIKAPDLGRARESYSYFLDDLERSGLKISEVGPYETDDFFVSRLSEFIFARANAGQSITPPLTEVHSNRRGDTVLYAKGYFLSTGAALGISTPAVATLPGGRYSFGILDSGSPRFESIVWDIPTKSKISLNLP